MIVPIKNILSKETYMNNENSKSSIKIKNDQNRVKINRDM